MNANVHVRGVSMDEDPVLPAVRATFRAVAQTVVPESRALDEAGWARLETVVEDALAARPPAMRRQLRLFLRALSLLPVLRWGRTFEGLDPQRRTRFLRAVQRAPVFLIRRGFWGLRTLIFMGYYARAEVDEEIGYRARLRGWLEHPDAPEHAVAAAREKLARERGEA